MRKQIIAITILTAFAEAAAAGAFEDPHATRDAGMRLTWTISFGGSAAPTPRPPASSLLWTQTAQRTEPSRLPPPPTSEPATSGEITTLPLDPPPPPPEEEGYFKRITGVQWLGIGLAVVALGVVAAGSGGGGDAPEPAPVGSGGG